MRTREFLKRHSYGFVKLEVRRLPTFMLDPNCYTNGNDE